MPIGCLQLTDLEKPAIGSTVTYNSTFARASDHVHHLAKYSSPEVSSSKVVRGRGRRPWDTPTKQLNEHGTGGYNFFRMTQTDEQRQWHADKLTLSKQSPKKRGKESLDALNKHELVNSIETLKYFPYSSFSSSAVLSSPASQYPPSSGIRPLSVTSSFSIGAVDTLGRQRMAASQTRIAWPTGPQRAIPPPRALQSERPTMMQLMEP